MFKISILFLLLVLTYHQDAEVLQLNERNFAQHVTNDQEQMWMIMFHADWCQHCHKLRPQFIKAAQLMKTYGIKFATVNQKGNNKLVAKYVSDPTTRMISYPALLVILGQQVLGRVPGHLVNSYAIRFWFLNYFKIVDQGNPNGGSQL